MVATDVCSTSPTVSILESAQAPIEGLRQRDAGASFEEQLQLHLPQRHKATEQDSTLRVEMTGLEEQADNPKARDLYWKPLSCWEHASLDGPREKGL
jgi:hypothetical protein